MSLDVAGYPVTLSAGSKESRGFRETLDPDQRAALDRCLARPVAAPFIQLQHGPLDSFSTPHEGAHYSIGRSMFETDALPSHWVSAANRLDELWVTSAFNEATFRAAGVRVPMHIVPGGIDSDTFCGGLEPFPVAGLRDTVFLSVFEWRLRKGWDVLLRAWADAFGPDDDVTLVLRTYPISRVDADRNVDVIDAQIDEFLLESCEGRTRADVAPIIVLGERVAGRDLPSLYNLASAFVLPTRGEGWGRPFMESMSCGVPVIATNWSAHLEFMNHENSYLVDIEGLVPADSSEVAVYAGQRWAAPKVAHLTTQLHRVHRDRAEARAIGARARHDMVHEWPWSRVADVITERMRAVDARIGRLQQASAVVVPDAAGVIIHGGHGDPMRPSSNASSWLNASLAFDTTPGVSVERLHPVSWRPSSKSPRPSYDTAEYLAWLHTDAAVAHCAVHVTVLDDATDTVAPTPPAEGFWFVDVGSTVTTRVPPHLVTTLRDQADRVVVPHETARVCCRAIGVADARIVVVEPAIDTERFSPTGAVYRHVTKAGTRFLVIGGDREHRSLPHIMSLFDRTFTADDDVLLHLVLPTGTRESSVWLERLAADVERGRRHPRLPRVWIDRSPIHEDEMPSLYRAADVLIHAGAATARGQSIREAMACGIPVIATDTAPANALIESRCGWHVPLTAHARADGMTLQAAFRAATIKSDRDRRGAAARARALAWPTPMMQHARLRALISEASAQVPRRIAGDPTSGTVTPMVVNDRRRVLLLVHADWHNGTTAAVVRTYAALYDAHADITLAICLDPDQGVSVDDAARIIGQAVASAGRSADATPDLLLLPDVLGASTLDCMHAAADVVVAVRNPSGAATARRANYDVIDSLDGRRWQSIISPRLAAPQAA